MTRTEFNLLRQFIGLVLQLLLKLQNGIDSVLLGKLSAFHRDLDKYGDNEVPK